MAITDSEQPRPSVVGGGSVYPSVQNLLLACRNEGLGCVLTTLLCMDEPAVKQAARHAGGLVHVRARADRVPGRRRLRPDHAPPATAKMVFRDRWDQAW